MDEMPDWMLRDLKRWHMEKGCEEMCKMKGDIPFCIHCMMGTATPEIIDDRIDRVLDDVQKNIDEYGWYVIVVQSPKTKISVMTKMVNFFIFPPLKRRFHLPS